MNFLGYINLDKKIPSFLIVSRYNEDYSWVEEYTSNYMIANKGTPIWDNVRVRNIDNIGGNQRDILEFIFENYINLPSLMAFVQANPFDHCRRDIFDKLIYNRHFTPIEYYGSMPANSFENRDSDGGFMEINNDWYIQAHNSAYGLKCRYQSFDDFMNHYFLNYKHTDWIRFAPGSQYIIERNQALQYPRMFWFSLMHELDSLRPTEGHIIERALYMILTNKFEIRKDVLQ